MNPRYRYLMEKIETMESRFEHIFEEFRNIKKRFVKQRAAQIGIILKEESKLIVLTNPHPNPREFLRTVNIEEGNPFVRTHITWPWRTCNDFSDWTIVEGREVENGR